MATTSQEWLKQLSEVLRLPAPTVEEQEAMLAVAGIAAHSSERTAAPLTTWLIGRSGMSISDARRAVEELARSMPSDPSD